MDALERFGDDGAHPEQAWTLGGPVARAAAAVLLAGQDDERNTFVRVPQSGVVDRHLLLVGQMRRPVALAAGHQLVAQPDVGEGAAHHHLVVATSRTVAVEVGPPDAVLDQVASGRAVDGNRTRG